MSQRGHLLYLCSNDPLRGVLGGGGLALVVALQYFDAAGWQKGLLSAAFMGGMLLAPMATQLVAQRQWSASRTTAMLSWAGVAGLLVAALSTHLVPFMVGVLVCGVMLSVCIPLITDLWRQNAPSSIRGRLFGFNLMVSAGFSLLVSLLIAAWMGDDPSRFRPVFWVLALLLALGGWASWCIPSRPLAQNSTRNPIACLALIWRAPLFGYMSLVWYFIGFANLSTLPLRVEFAGSRDGGLGLSPGSVLLLTVVLPETLRLISLPFWARLFDRINFIVLRMGINACFLLSVYLFFQGDLTGMVLGNLFLGLGMGGGNIAWSLWVTKFSPPDRTAEYMAAHTFLTGTRGLLGPQVAFWALGSYGMSQVVNVAVGLLLLSIVLLIPILPHGNRRGSKP